MDIWQDILSTLPIGALALLPGVVWMRCENKLAVPARVDVVERGLSYLLYSFISYAVVYLMFSSEVEALQVSNGLSLGLVILTGFALMLVGAVGGVLTGWLRNHDVVGSVLRKGRIFAVHPEQSGWACAFKRKHGCLVRLTFTDGTDRFGIFGTASLASCNSTEREDLFLEYTFCEDEHGDLIPEEGSLGIWVSKDELTCVRFYDHQALEAENVKISARTRRELRCFGGVASEQSGGEAACAGHRSEEGGDQGCSPSDIAAEAEGLNSEPVGPVQVESLVGRGDVRQPAVLHVLG